MSNVEQNVLNLLKFQLEKLMKQVNYYKSGTFILSYGQTMNM